MSQLLPCPPFLPPAQLSPAPSILFQAPGGFGGAGGFEPCGGGKQPLTNKLKTIAGKMTSTKRSLPDPWKMPQ